MIAAIVALVLSLLFLASLWVTGRPVRESDFLYGMADELADRADAQRAADKLAS